MIIIDAIHRKIHDFDVDGEYHFLSMARVRGSIHWAIVGPDNTAPVSGVVYSSQGEILAAEAADGMPGGFMAAIYHGELEFTGEMTPELRRALWEC